MHPYLFQLNLPWGGTFKAASYGFMILIGFLLCLWLVQRRGRRMGMDPTAIFDATIVGLFGGIIGARIFYVLDNWSQFSGDLWQIVRLDRGGLTQDHYEKQAWLAGGRCVGKYPNRKAQLDYTRHKAGGTTSLTTHKPAPGSHGSTGVQLMSARAGVQISTALSTKPECRGITG